MFLQDLRFVVAFWSVGDWQHFGGNRFLQNVGNTVYSNKVEDYFMVMFFKRLYSQCLVKY